MCWISRDLKIEIAKEDIPVWKVVYKIKNTPEKCRSYYGKYIYTKNNYEYTPIDITILSDGHVEGNKGFHSYSDELKGVYTTIGIDVAIKSNSSMINIVLINYPMECNLKMARFFIPKGAQYMKNDVGEIISNTIIFDEFIDENI